MNEDQLLKVFEAEWQAGKTPGIADFLTAVGADRAFLLIELVHLDLEFRIKRGEPVRVERYLEAYPELLEQTGLLLDLLAAEYCLRRRTERDLRLEEYYERFPQYAANLLERLPETATFEQVYSPVGQTADRAAVNTIRKWPSIPGCEVLRQIGHGGMGVVYLARQTALDRLVAVKMMPSRCSPDGPEHHRFRLEGLAVARLRHPNIAQLYEVGDVDGQPYYLLEYLEGGSLADRLGGIPLPATRAAALMEPLALAMHHAHEQGVVHRDLKPANVLLSRIEDGGSRIEDRPEGAILDLRSAVPKITDFGLAKFLEQQPDLTRTGMIVGTVSYMAPEQAAGRPHEVGPAADVYALGAILYEMLTGRPPFQGESALQTLEQVRTQEPVPPARLQPRTPRDVETICLTCLRKEPGKRYTTALALAEDLRRFLDGKPILARPTPWWERVNKWCHRQPLAAAALGALLVALILGGTGVAWQWRLAVLRAQEAQEARAEETVQREAAVRRLYFNQIARAQQALPGGRPLEAERLLLDCQAATPELCLWEWRYLKRQLHGARRTFRGHESEIRGLVVTPDGRRVISASGMWHGTQAPGRVIVSDADTGACLRQLQGVGPGVQELALDRQGKLLAAAGSDGMVRLWDLEAEDPTPVALAPEVKVGALGVAFAPAGDRLAGGYSDSCVRVWDLKTRQATRLATGHGDTVFAVAFSPDGKWLASAARDGTVVLRDAATYQVVDSFKVLDSAVAVAFGPDSRRLAVGNFTGLIYLWDLDRRGAPTWTRTNDDGPISALAFTPDGLYLAWCKTAHGAQLIDLATAKLDGDYRGHDKGVRRLAFAPDCRQLYTGGGDGLVRSWDLVAPDEPLELRPYIGAYLYQFAYSPDGKWLALPGGRSQSHNPDARERTLLKWCVSGMEPNLVFKGHTGWLKCVAYRPDGKQIATGSEDRTVRLWDANDPAVHQTLKDHQGTVTALAYTPDGKLLLSGCADHQVRAWDAADGTLQRTLVGHTGPVTAVACCPTGRYAASASTDKTVRLWDLERSTLAQEIRCPTGVAAAGVAFSRDGALLACAFAD
jgi:WD40 repeat protein